MKTKLEMAHEWALVFTQQNKDLSVAAKTVSLWAFDYADAMQAEADKRNQYEPMKGVRKQEWQPDWNQAPDGRVQYFAVDENGRGGWYVNKPDLCRDHWYWSDFEERIDNDCYDYAPSFNYQGDWRDSLRKRPK